VDILAGGSCTFDIGEIMKTAVAIAFAIASLGAAEAHAQAGMNCSKFAGQVTCKESAERLNRENMERMERSRAAMDANRPSAADVAALRQQRLEKKVAAAIKAGKCDEAKQIALDAGNLDVADKAMRLCTPAS
jgi:hypothetical protein